MVTQEVLVSVYTTMNFYMQNTEIKSSINTQGINLEEVIVCIDACNSLFADNDVSSGIFDLYDTEIYFFSSTIVNHYRSISGTVVTIPGVGIDHSSTIFSNFKKIPEGHEILNSKFCLSIYVLYIVEKLSKR